MPKHFVRNLFAAVLYSVADKFNKRSATAADFRAAAPTAMTKPGAPLPTKATTNGDYAREMLPEQVDVRSRWGQLIKEVTSNGMHARWIFVCDRCGTNNFIGTVLHNDRKVPCMGGCGREFSITALQAEAIRKARVIANQERGANIPLNRPFTDEEIENWYFTLPELCPTTQTSSRDALKQRIDEQINDPKAGEVEWVGSRQAAEPLESSLGFANPGSASWRR
jgi:hypothetical protein